MRPAASDEIQRTVTVGGQVLQDICLEIETGSVVCLAGATGSGKSTLLKILAGVKAPTEGRIELLGSVSSLLGIADNLDARLTALENIETQRRFRRIADGEALTFGRAVIAFAGLEGFERVPVRTYSTGMTMRLSIALALHGNPSVVLIDDVLGVGDIAFQQQCVDRLHALKATGCTLVLAFSDEDLVRQLADRVITLSAGRIAGDGPPTQMFVGQHGFGATDVAWEITPHLPEDDVVALRSIAATERQAREEVYLDLSLRCETKAASVRCRPRVFVMHGKVVVFTSLHPSDLEVPVAGGVRFTVAIPVHLLRQGVYTITVGVVSVIDRVVHSLKAHDAVTLDVQRGFEAPDGATSVPLLGSSLPWEIEALDGADA